MENALDQYKIITIVHPPSNDPGTSGRVINLHCGGGVCHPHVVRTQHGWTLRESFRQKGYRMLQEVYAQEQNLEGWERYQRYVAAWQSGQTRSPFPPQWLPEYVQNARRCLVSDEFADAFRSPPVTGAAKQEAKSGDEVKPEEAPSARKGKGSAEVRS